MMDADKMNETVKENKEQLINFLIERDVSKDMICFLEDKQKFDSLLWYQKITSLIEKSGNYTESRSPRIPLECLRWSKKSNPIKIQKINIESTQVLDLTNFQRYSKRRFNMINYECFCNALKFLVDFEGGYYIEGFVVYTDNEDNELSIVHHSWNMIHNKFIDITYEMFIPEYYQYYDYYMYLKINLHHLGGISYLFKLIEDQQKHFRMKEMIKNE